MLPGDRALLEVGLVATAVGRDALEAPVDLDDRGNGAGEEFSVMAHDDNRGLRVLDEFLEEVQALAIEVVGGLVEEVCVISGQEEPSEAHPGRLPARQGGHGEV